jgi:uncharacterized membrane protein
MSRQLSRSEKSRVVFYSLAALLDVFAAIINAMAGSWFTVLIFVGVGVCFAFEAYRVATAALKNRGSGEPQPDTINPGAPE